MSRIKKTPEIGTFNIGDCYVENLMKTLQFISLIQPIWDTTWSVSHREDAKNPVVLHPLRYGPTIKQTSKLSWFQTHLQNNIVNKSIPFIKNLNETCNHLFTSCLPPWFHKKKHPDSFTTSPLSYRKTRSSIPPPRSRCWYLGRWAVYTPPNQPKPMGNLTNPQVAIIREKFILILEGHALKVCVFQAAMSSETHR